MPARPLRLRWTPFKAGPIERWWLTLDLGLHGRAIVSQLERDQIGPNTYIGRTATGQVLRSNNRRRLQKRLKDAVCAELARVARRAA